MKEIYEKIIKRAENKKFSVLATIIVQKGSTPRGIGTKFVIMEDGSFMGTIGGGQLEARVLEEAEKVIDTRFPLRLNFVLKGTDVEKTEMLCGGDAEVFLEPISPENQGHLDLYKKALEVIDRESTGMMATVVDPYRWAGGRLPKLFFESGAGGSGSLTGQQEQPNQGLRSNDPWLNLNRMSHASGLG